MSSTSITENNPPKMNKRVPKKSHVEFCSIGRCGKRYGKGRNATGQVNFMVSNETKAHQKLLLNISSHFPFFSILFGDILYPDPCQIFTLIPYVHFNDCIFIESNKR